MGGRLSMEKYNWNEQRWLQKYYEEIIQLLEMWKSGCPQ